MLDGLDQRLSLSHCQLVIKVDAKGYEHDLRRSVDRADMIDCGHARARGDHPADLQAALERSPEAAAFFRTLSGANRYAILYRIAAVKKPETRARKIAGFIAMLEQRETMHG